jgi:uncharacterized protein (DUF1778 family)
MESSFILDRMVRAVEKVRERLRRAAKALGDAGMIRKDDSNASLYLDALSNPWRIRCPRFRPELA